MKYEHQLLFALLLFGTIALTGCVDLGMPSTPPPYYNVNYYLNETNETLKLYVKNNTNLGYTIYGNEGFFDYLQANNFTGGLISTDYGYFQIVDIYNGSMDVAYIGTATIDNASINNAVVGNLSGDSLSFITIRTDNLYVNESIYGTNITVDAVYAGDLYGYIDAGYITGESWLDSGDQRYNETALIISVNNSLTSTIVEINNTLNSRIDNITLYGPWVLKAGDTMTGNLNMSNNNITDVDTLYVHNISGRSPINILSDVISNNSITADMFYGNINGQNGTIYGVSIVNGSIVNLHVTESAWVDSNMSVNGTFRAREYGSMSPIIFVDENGTQIAQISSKGTFEENVTYGYIRAQEIIVDRLSIIGLLNYSPSEPPDYYFSDEVWINKVPNINNTQFTFYFNESTLNMTLVDFAFNLNNTINQSFSNLSSSIDYLFILISDEVQARINNDTALDLRINVTNGRIDAINLSMANYYTKNETDLLLDNKLNVTDQRYNDTLLILEVNNSLNLTNANLAQEILDRIAGDQALNGSIISVNNTMYILINNTNIALQNEIIDRINNDSYLQAQIDAINGSVLFASGDQTLNGNLIITGNFSVIGSFVNLNVIQQTVNGSIYPGVSGLFDIGSPSLVWNNVYSNLFVGQMDASNITNAPWLLITDQRYNETALIVALNQTKLDITDQRYNDTGYIDALILVINETKLDITDQRYNDTGYIDALILVINQSKLDITDQRYNDTAYINGLITILNQTKLDITDQRYNDTGLILEVNQTLSQAITNLYSFLDNYYNKTEIDLLLDNKLNVTDQRYNDTTLIINLTDELWLAKLNNTDQRFNETLLVLNLTDELWQAKLNVTDQRYNDTLFIVNLSDELWLYKLNITDQRYNETLFILNLTDTLDLLKLNITDQRYNDTLLVLNLTDELWLAKLNITDQRYNNTLLIVNLTDELWLAKLNITDQRYNETSYIDYMLNASNNSFYVLLQNYYNKTESDERYRLLTVPINTSEVNKTTGTSYLGMLLDSIIDLITGRIDSLNTTKLDTTDQRYNETSMIDALNQSKLDIIDQRYNDTALILVINNSLNYTNAVLAQEILDRIAGDIALNGSILSVNSTLVIRIDNVNSTLQQEITDRISNDSYLQSQITIINNSVLHNTGDQTLNGNLLINGNLSVIGSFVNLNVVQQTVNGSIYPGLDGIFDLGSTSLVWNTVYANLFVGSIDASNITNSPWLLMSDQRYNETALFVSLDNSKLNITDQRYNDTGLILFINSTKLDITDQRYNDTSYIDSLIYIINMSKLDITDQRYNETGLIYNLINALNASKLDITDQRYNETSYIDGLILAINLSKLDITDQRYNETAGIVALNETKLEFVDNIYLYKENVTVYLNESKLNFTINNISEVVSYTIVVQVNVSGGAGTAITDVIEYEITQIIVVPTTSTNSYKFAAYEYPSGNIIDKDLKNHVGTWNIMKSYALDSQVQLNITNANIDEPFFVTIKYLNNGLQ